MGKQGIYFSAKFGSEYKYWHQSPLAEYVVLSFLKFKNFANLANLKYVKT